MSARKRVVDHENNLVSASLEMWASQSSAEGL
jgi:hypothetical protein